MLHLITKGNKRSGSCSSFTLVHVICLRRCTFLQKHWQKELLKWACQVLWPTALHPRQFWSVLQCVLFFFLWGGVSETCHFIINTWTSVLRPLSLIHVILLPSCTAGRWKIVTWFWEASSPASLWGLHPRRNNHLWAPHTGAGRREGINHECCRICHRESQRARSKVCSREPEMMAAAGCLLWTIHGTLTEKNLIANWVFLGFLSRETQGQKKERTQTKLFCFLSFFSLKQLQFTFLLYVWPKEIYVYVKQYLKIDTGDEITWSCMCDVQVWENFCTSTLIIQPWCINGGSICLTWVLLTSPGLLWVCNAELKANGNMF